MLEVPALLSSLLSFARSLAANLRVWQYLNCPAMLLQSVDSRAKLPPTAACRGKDSDTLSYSCICQGMLGGFITLLMVSSQASCEQHAPSC